MLVACRRAARSGGGGGAGGVAAATAAAAAAATAARAAAVAWMTARGVAGGVAAGGGAAAAAAACRWRHDGAAVAVTLTADDSGTRAKRAPPRTPPVAPLPPPPPLTPPRSFVELGVPALWQERLAAAGITTPTETQARALPVVLAGQHVIIKGETGSGKTLAYLLPVLDAVRQRWVASGGVAAGGPQAFACALIIVPTQELVHQLLRVATALAPEVAASFRGVYSNRGVSRSDSCGLIIATPTALKDNVNYKHLTELRYLVLDEADMLLSGSYFPITQGYVLAKFKQREPERRPQHIFCAATLPARGRESVAAFLDAYYPPSEVVRVTTTGAHRALPACSQHFIQLDAALPPTAAEREAAARLARKAAAAAAAAAGDKAAAAAAADADADPDTDAGADDGDAIAAAMRERGEEDHELALRAEDAARAERLDMLRKHALLEALLAPSAVADADAPPPPAAAAALAPAAPAAPRIRRRSAALVGVERVERAHDAVHAPAALLAAAPPLVAAPPPADAAARPAPVTVTSLATPRALRMTLRDDEAARVPPTLVFVNSADGAEAVRKWLVTAAPALRVAALHKKVDEGDRSRAIAAFAAGDVRVLVCTDVASRGLDTLGVRHVIQADMASDVVTHLHRIGRTARAGSDGAATALYTRTASDLVAAIAAAAAAGAPVDDAFSRRRSFRKRTKAAVVQAAEDTAVMAVLEAEQAAAEDAAAAGAGGAPAAAVPAAVPAAAAPTARGGGRRGSARGARHT